MAIVRDETTFMHANAFHMAVVLEPIAEPIARSAQATAIRPSFRRL